MRTIALIGTAALMACPAAVSAAPGGEPGPGGVEKVEGFVCPVIKTENVLHSPKGIEIAGGHYSIAGPHGIRIPRHATNDDGEGDPMGDHAAPGDEDYTAIWNIC